MFRFPLREGLELRLVEERHAEAIFAIVDRDRDYLRKWLAWVDGTTSVDTIAEFARKSLLQFARNEGFAAGIWAGNQYVGTVGFHVIDWPNRKAELGYWLDREQQGNGIMTAACRAMLAHAFKEWKLNRVEIRCTIGNRPSNRVAERLGFQLEGTLRQGQLLYGTYHDLNLYGLLASEWKG